MPRILCLDYGERRSGVAISDETRTIAQSLATITHNSETELCSTISRLIKEYDVDLIVIGLPLSLSGKPSTRSEKVRAFAARLAKKVHLPVELFDERLSTNQAEEVYAEVYGRPYRRYHPHRQAPASPLDRIAATIVLKDYLEFIRRTRTVPPKL